MSLYKSGLWSILLGTIPIVVKSGRKAYTAVEAEGALPPMASVLWLNCAQSATTKYSETGNAEEAHLARKVESAAEYRCASGEAHDPINAFPVESQPWVGGGFARSSSGSGQSAGGSTVGIAGPRSHHARQTFSQ